jgi:hypothetical protein
MRLAIIFHMGEGENRPSLQYEALVSKQLRRDA